MHKHSHHHRHLKNAVTFPPKDAKGVVTYLVGIVVIGSLGYWWYTSELPLSQWIGSLGSKQEQSSGTSNPSTGNTSAKSGSALPSSIQGEKDVASIIASLPSVSSFRSYLTSTGVGASLHPGSKSPYTVFVPTNTSIARLTKGTISGLSSADQARLVKYHVIVGREVDAKALLSGTLTSLSGDVLNFSMGADGVARVNSSAIIGTYKATNGIVYVVDGVLLPPKR